MKQRRQGQHGMPMVQQRSLCLGFKQEHNGGMGLEQTRTPGWQGIAL
jgi:hypothetical protein